MASNSNSRGLLDKGRRIGLIYDDRMCKHSSPADESHPENPNRILSIWNKLNSSGITQRCIVLNGKEAEDNDIALVHTRDHIDLIKNISSKKIGSKRSRIASKFNSIYFNEGSSESAYLSAGSVVEVAEKVAGGELDSAFAIVRPPGHHAEENEPMGFCLYNNVAIATHYLLDKRPDLGIKKILIVDWDVHHGNGTQKTFWKDSRVLFFSVHRHDSGSFYPGGEEGSHVMIGEGPGAGYNINVPWENGRCGDADYVAVWDHVLIPVAQEFDPDLIIVSAGFDAAIGDPLGGCRVSPYGYSVMLHKLLEFAGGKIVMALEGGYNLVSIAKSVQACIEVLLQQKPIVGSCVAYPFESTWRVIQSVREVLSVYWPKLAERLPEKITSTRIPYIEAVDEDLRDDAIAMEDGSAPAQAASIDSPPRLISIPPGVNLANYVPELPPDLMQLDGTSEIEFFSRYKEEDICDFVAKSSLRGFLYAVELKERYARLRHELERETAKQQLSGTHLAVATVDLDNTVRQLDLVRSQLSASESVREQLLKQGKQDSARISHYQAELAKLRGELDESKLTHESEVACLKASLMKSDEDLLACRDELEKLEANAAPIRAENAHCRARIKELEAQVGYLQLSRKRFSDPHIFAAEWDTSPYSLEEYQVASGPSPGSEAYVRWRVAEGRLALARSLNNTKTNFPEALSEARKDANEIRQAFGLPFEPAGGSEEEDFDVPSDGETEGQEAVTGDQSARALSTAGVDAFSSAAKPQS